MAFVGVAVRDGERDKTADEASEFIDAIELPDGLAIAAAVESMSDAPCIVRAVGRRGADL